MNFADIKIKLPAIVKVLFVFEGKQEVDYLINGKGIFTQKDYSNIPSENIISAQYQIDHLEYKYFKKNIPTITPANGEHFFLALALGVDINDVLNKNYDLLFAKYREKFLSFLKNNYFKSVNSKPLLCYPAFISYSPELESAILSIKDFSALLQYLPHNSDYYNLYQKRNNLKIAYIDRIRIMLYNALFSRLQPFRNIFDDEMGWVLTVLNELKIEGLKSANFDNINDIFLPQVREYWQAQINQTYKRALTLLNEEKESAIKFEDNEALEEIEIIKKEINKTVAEIDLTQFKTIKELLKFWPDILTPGPVTLYPYR
jgi:hypothetical protein